MKMGLKGKAAIVGALVTGVLAVSNASAFADSYDGGAVSAYGCNAFIMKSSPNHVYAQVGGGSCWISIDQTNKYSGSWSKPYWWQTGTTGAVYVGNGYAATACITNDPTFSYETCGPLVWS